MTTTDGADDTAREELSRSARVEKQEWARDRRRREFDHRLFEYVSMFVAGPRDDDVDKWRDRLRELSAELFDQVSP